MLILATLCCLSNVDAQTNPSLPTGGRVVAGSANITQNGSVMNVNQTSQRTVVNWDSFNVGKGATVNFNQPNASAVTLNRVTGNTASAIDGAVRANGQVVLVNPNGVTFGRGSEVNAAGVVASTLNINDKDFMDGKSNYKGNGSGKIINDGTITATGLNGYIALLAPEVQNQGVLVAKMGGANNTIALAAGQEITLSFTGDRLLSVNIDAGVVNGLIENKRAVKTDGGYIVFAASAANRLMASTINNSGRISASSITSNGGVIELVASNIKQAGQISANGNGQAANGGKITMQGEDITLADGSNTNAKGSANGGLINVGTTKVTFTQNADGSRTDVKAENLAKTVTVAEKASIDVSSTQKGNGGDINVWSSAKTTVAGTFKAEGGSLGGNGGFIETSSSGVLDILKSTVVLVSAKLGKAGSWLLDPENMVIDASTASAVSAALATSNVTIEVKGDLTVSAGAAIAPTNGAATTLTLNATGTITNNGTISTSDTGSLVTNSAALSLSAGSTTSANQITATAQAVTVNGALSSTGGSTGSINVTGGAIIIAGRVSSNGSSSNTGTSTTSSANTIRTREEELAAQAPTTTANANTTNNNTTAAANTATVLAQLAAKATAAAAATAVAATVASNNVAANAAMVSAQSTALRPAMNVINMTAPSAVALNANIAQAASAAQSGTTTIINIASSATSSTPSAPYAPMASMTFTAQTPAQVAQAAAAASASSASANTSGGSITLVASNSVTATSTATITANATTAVSPIDNAQITGSGGSITIAAPQVVTQSASVMQANGNNGPGGNFNLQATQLSIAGQVQANGNTGGTISTVAQSSNLQSGALIQANGNNGPGGAITLQTTQNQVINNAQLQANGSGNGGNIQISTTSGDINLQSAIIQTNGSNGRGGQIGIAATNYTSLESSTVEATGYTQGGTIKVGYDAQTQTLPFSIFANLDALSILNSSQTNLSNNTAGGYIETSGQTINLLSSINAGRGGIWLIDPVDITINASLASSISTALQTSSVTLNTSGGGSCINVTCPSFLSGLGDITLNSSISWSSNSLLTLIAQNNIYINSTITASSISAKLTLQYGQATINAGNTSIYLVNAAINLQSGNNFTTRLGSDGAPINYIVISTLGSPGSINGSDLQGINGVLGGNFALGSNIDATVTSTWNTGAGFSPIGSLATPFTGNFEGLGHTISYLTINQAGIPNIGLFGNTSGAVGIQNIGLVGGSTTGGAGTGGLIGNSDAGLVSNSYNTGNVTGGAGTGGLVGSSTAGNITKSYATGIIVGAAGSGGLEGSVISGSISNSYATGNVTGNAGTGGLVGSITSGNVSSSFATGNINGAAGTGGLVGSSTSGNVTNTYATGNVTGNAGTGGLVGSITSGAITNSYAVGSVAGAAGTGGIVGATSGAINSSYWNTTTGPASSVGGGTGLTTIQMQQQSNFLGWDFSNTWLIYSAKTYPLLQYFMTPLTVTTGSPTMTYSGNTYSGVIGITYSTPPSGNLLGISTFSGPWSTAIGVGSYGITSSGLYSNQLGYKISYIDGSLSITKAHLTVTANDAIKIYGDANPLLSATVSGFVNSQTLATSGVSGVGSSITTATATTGVGTVIITGGVGTLAASNYDFINLVNGSLVISPKAATVTNNVSATTYNGTTTYASLVSAAGFTVGGLLAPDQVGSVTQATTISGGTLVSGVAQAGSFIATPSTAVMSTGLASNYSFTYTPATNTVAQASLTIAGTASLTGNIYKGSSYTSAYTTTFLGSDAASATVTGMVNQTNAATYTSALAVSGAVLSNYTTPVIVNADFEVSPLTIVITSPNSSKTYSGSTQSNTGATVSINGASATTISGATVNTGIGSQSFILSGYGSGTNANTSAYADSLALTAGAGTTAGNYAITYSQGSLTINQAPLAVILNNATRLINTPNPLFTFTVNGYVGSDNASNAPVAVTVITSAITTSPPGNYIITSTSVAPVTNNYYMADDVDGILSVIVGSIPNTTPPSSPSSPKSQPILAAKENLATKENITNATLKISFMPNLYLPIFVDSATSLNTLMTTGGVQCTNSIEGDISILNIVCVNSSPN